MAIELGAKEALDDVLKVAAELLRMAYDDLVPDPIGDRLRGYALRLKRDRDAQVVVERNGSRQTVRQRAW